MTLKCVITPSTPTNQLHRRPHRLLLHPELTAQSPPSTCSLLPSQTHLVGGRAHAGVCAQSGSRRRPARSAGQGLWTVNHRPQSVRAERDFRDSLGQSPAFIDEETEVRGEPASSVGLQSQMASEQPV